MSTTILVPLDIADEEMTRLVVPFVKTQAKALDANVHFLTVVPDFRYYASLEVAYVGEFPDVEQYSESALAQLKEMIALFELPADKTSAQVEMGSPRDKILESADKLKAQMIIIASHRPSIATYLLGSNAAAVVRHAKCPVLVVR